ncbi:cecropin-C type 2-like [Tribolium castaneum]|uniref:cecropin-C type 2-like n=1 Tax=Tribolium castaneum TaxID=7070 RepID=UPI0030FE24DC
MKLSVIFFFALLLLNIFVGRSEARWKGFKKKEKAGRRVFEHSKEALPVVQGYAAVATALGKK